MFGGIYYILIMNDHLAPETVVVVALVKAVAALTSWSFLYLAECSDVYSSHMWLLLLSLRTNTCHPLCAECVFVLSLKVRPPCR